MFDIIKELDLISQAIRYDTLDFKLDTVIKSTSRNKGGYSSDYGYFIIYNFKPYSSGIYHYNDEFYSDNNEDSYRAILCHEMTHCWLHKKDIKKAGHGPWFKYHYAYLFECFVKPKLGNQDLLKFHYDKELAQIKRKILFDS